MRSRLAWPAVSSAVLAGAALALTTGCGSNAATRPPPPPPKIPRSVAAGLARQADALAASLGGGDRCDARSQVTALRKATLGALPEVPLRFPVELSRTVDGLAGRVPVCPPPAPRAPPKKPAKNPEKHHENGKKHHEH